MNEMEKAYSPAAYESLIYEAWESSGAFKPAESDKEPFSIIMPPPNANGSLHTGHAMYTVEDIMVRYNRMLGRPTLWLPGTDHAGIETQVVFERELAKQGKSRFDYSPAQFYDMALEYSKKNQHNIISQLKSLGFSADWSRLKFTLDDDVVSTVYDTFEQMLNDGHIYRGNRIVNWCPHCHSGFADIEIKYRTQSDPLYFIKYGPFVLATVRPETKFGDTAVAVNPDDVRYAHMIGEEIEVEGLQGLFKLKVIGDSFVDPAFGTGVIKVTPAHDPNDWEIGQRHNLEVKQVIGTDGKLTELAGKYAGMPVAEARAQVAHDLEERGLIDHIEMDYTHSIAVHGRCGTPIEPLVIEQWWLQVGELKKAAIAAVENADIQIVPPRFKKIYIDWMNNLKDWNISRQNWFGIKIPIYYRASDDETKAQYKMFRTEAEAVSYYGEGGYEAETDTFDTWFSSSQWPYATLMGTGDFDRFYPTTVMETGRDILTIWVTRMIMMGLYRTEKVPFKAVYLHGMVNDAHGKKMSKSKGNVINPLDLTKTYGSDALRLALTIGITPGNDGALSEKKVEGYRNFVNKLWNVARYILENQDVLGAAQQPVVPTSLADRWILTKFSRENYLITKAIEEYRFSEAGERVYSLLWNELADWYIESSKVQRNDGVLVHCLEHILKLAHPFAPFVTEAIWSKMAWQKQKLIISPWPAPGDEYEDADEFEHVKALVSQVRTISTTMQLSKPKLEFANSAVAQENSELIKRLGKLGEVTGQRGDDGGLKIQSPLGKIHLAISRAQISSYTHKLEQEKQTAKVYAERLRSQLLNPTYIQQAPAHLVQQTKDRLAETELLESTLDEQIKAVTN